MFNLVCKASTGAALVMALVMATGVPAVAAQDRYDASYQDRGNEYDGYCYQREGDSGRGHPVTGAVVGGAIGGSVASTHHKGEGAAIGALLGAAIGSQAGKHRDDRCLNGDYYAYEGSYYDPAPPPDGYTVIFFRTRPSSDLYTNIHYNRRRDRSEIDGYQSSHDNW